MRYRTRAGTIAALAVTVAVMVAGCGSGSAAEPTRQTTATQQTALLPSQQEIAALFPEWNTALATGDPQKVADLYAPDAVLLPTVSNEVRSNRAEIVDYFTKFLQSKPQGVIDDEAVDALDADTAINTGVYTFTLTKDGKQQQVKARYTFVYELIDGRWLITNHHSSAMPEG